MAQADDTEGKLYQNLIDIGCSEAETKQYLTLAKKASGISCVLRLQSKRQCC